MFTLEKIKNAHAKVKSGADFPMYVQELKSMGVSYYHTYVSDGHTDYFGEGNYKVSTPPRYENLKISSITLPEQFQHDLKAHQQGKTDYPTFCSDSAQAGIEKWIVLMDEMTCTYYNREGQVILTEVIG